MFYSEDQRLLTSGVFMDTVRVLGPCGRCDHLGVSHRCVFDLVTFSVVCSSCVLLFSAQLYRRLTAAATGTHQPDWDYTSYPRSVTTPGSRQYLGPSLYLYSAHDTTVASVLSAMRIFDG